MKPKRPRSIAPWLLMASITLGVTAGVSYFVPIPGLTYASPAAPVDATKPDAPPKDPLQEREAELAKAQAEVKSREETVASKEAQVASLLKDLTAQKSEVDAVRKAVALYTAMPPTRAAPLMQALDTEMAVQILRQLEDDQAAAILTYMSPEKGALLMKELAKPPLPKPPAKQ